MKTLQQLFKRYRRPGDLVFAIGFLLLSAFLFSQIGSQTQWKAGAKISSQPALWSIISIFGMVIFASLNVISSWVSPRIEGRLVEIGFWIRSLEFVLWFMVYVAAVPRLGYLPATILFAIALALRMGYRTRKMLLLATVAAVGIVVVFKTFLQVRVPGGAAYEYLPDTLRSFMLTYF